MEELGIPASLLHPTYTATQVQAYYDRINLPPKHRHEPGSASKEAAQSATEGLPFLTALMQHHLCAIPWDNLDMHYSCDHNIHLEPEGLFQKMVVRHRGGYCMENNILFGTILRTLGFTFYSTGARVNTQFTPKEGEPPRTSYRGWDHMIHLVKIDSKFHLADVGASSIGSRLPMELVADRPQLNIAPQLARLHQSTLDDHTASGVNQSNRWWLLQLQHEPEKNSDWYTSYCFSELEFLPWDFRVMSLWTSSSRNSFFTYNILASRAIMGEGGLIEGAYNLMNGRVTRKVRGEQEVLLECKTETERVDMLREYFGIALTSEEREAIRHTSTELKG